MTVNEPNSSGDRPFDVFHQTSAFYMGVILRYRVKFRRSISELYSVINLMGRRLTQGLIGFGEAKLVPY